MDTLNVSQQAVNFTNINKLDNGVYHSGTCDIDEQSAVGGIGIFVVCLGMCINIYMLILQERTHQSSEYVEWCFKHIAYCDIGTLMAMPIWVMRTMSQGRWMFGRLPCKLIRAVSTVGT